jgi:hypothetical protein
MEIILIVIILVVVAATTVHYSSRNYKFSCVRRYLDSGDGEKAEALLLKIKDKHYEAALLHLQLKRETAAKVDSLGRRNTLYKELLTGISFKGKETDKRLQEETEEIVELVVQLHTQLINDAVRVQHLSAAAGHLRSAKQHAKKFGKKAPSKEREKVIELAISNGKTSELAGYLDQAESDYSIGKELTGGDEASIDPRHHFFVVRSCILELKGGDLPAPRRIRELAVLKTPESKELVYRFALFTAQQGYFTGSAELIKDFLSGEEHPALNELAAYNRNAASLDANVAAKKLNRVIDSDSPDELYATLENLTYYESKITKVRPEEKRKMAKLPSFLFSRTIALHFEARSFSEALRLISSREKFFNEPKLLKNAGIACLNIANQQQLTGQNYKLVICTWLAAIYNDKVLVDSLESTSWDDDYSFTLLDSLGKSDPEDLKLPDNVNYGTPSRENIAIGEVQRILLKEFEKNIHSLPQSELNSSIQQFYSEQQTALDEVAINTKNLRVYATPYFAQRFSGTTTLIKKIRKSFAHEDKAGQEKMYEVALPYINNKSPKSFQNYAEATTLFVEMTNALQAKKEVLLSTAKAMNLRKSLAGFSRLTANYEDKIAVLLALVSDSTSNDKIVTFYEEARFVFPVSDILKHQHLEAILDWTVEGVNNDLMSNGVALSKLVEAAEISTSNHRLLKSIGTLAKMNCVDYLNDELTRSGQTALNDLKAINKGRVRQCVTAEVAPILRSLVETLVSNDRRSARMVLNEAGITMPGDTPIDFPTDGLNFGSSLNEHGRQLAIKLRFINIFANI